MENDMAVAVTEKYEEMVLEVETAVPGTYTIICGMVDVTVSRAASVDTSEVPDCADESLPMSLEKEVRSIEVKVSASGVWAQSSQDMLSDWFYSSNSKNIRVRNTKAATGDTETEAGPALLVKLDNMRTKGKKVSAEIEIEFDGTPTRTNKV
jgi:hypothetical protein